jgi:ATP-binding cassette, sub-family E, member 1
MVLKEQSKQERIAVVDYDSCSPESCGNFLCMRVCPVNRQGKECILENPEKNAPLISEELCTGCQICATKCPRRAISIVNLTAKLGEPLHRYGANSFRVYRMPYPKKFSSVGLIGKNGTGKSTILNVLSAKTIPNLGHYNEPASYSKVIDFFSGKELQNFFKGLSEKKIKVSLKPQKVDEIPLAVKGKVKNLLENVDERNVLDALIKQLDLKPVLNLNLSELSGGELQRVAIAAAASKQADVYAFDEPSSYLDVRQRINAAKIISSLANEKTSVLVIEHDLALLDYLSDLVHIVFGKPGTYGVVSNPKSTRSGINEFLNGFIKDENLRFRNREISFEVRPPSEERKKKPVSKYSAISKTFSGGFSLTAQEGTLFESEVIGILGANGTGKTTFVKILAGAEKTDSGETVSTLPVSHKPQYISPEKGFTVQSFLESKEIDWNIFNTQVDKRLFISELSEKELIHLSGGELQKVAVALALCRQNYSLLLLDEPSAFVDVEDRIAMAHAIKGVVNEKEKTALVVDHDLMFIDSVADRLLVFSGTPSKNGFAKTPLSMQDGMNSFLKEMDITFRRDKETGRARANKHNSVLDREQKQKNQYYYRL